MNRENVQAVRDALASEKYGFNMMKYWPDAEVINGGCGTAGCIAGHAISIWPETFTVQHSDKDFSWVNESNAVLAEKLDLDIDELEKWFIQRHKVELALSLENPPWHDGVECPKCDSPNYKKGRDSSECPDCQHYEERYDERI